MTPGQRFLIAGLLVAGAEALLGVLLAGTVLAPFFFGCAAASAVLAWAARPLFRQPPRDDPPDPGEDDPEPPPWWPEFEAEFRRHLRDREPVGV